MTWTGRWRSRLWLLIPAGAFIVYLFSFSDRPRLVAEIDVLADADAADHALLIQELDVRRQYGDEWNFQDRTAGDRVQRHKMLHILFHLVGHPLFVVLRAVLGVFGISATYALYAVPALLGALNLVLLHDILGRLDPSSGARRPVYLVLAGFALSPWIYASITDSWVFTVTLVLGFMALWLRSARRPWLVAVYVGVAMLNNVSLIALHVFTGLHAASQRRGWGQLLAVAVGAGAVSIAVWLGALGALSVFDPDFAPAHMLAAGSHFRRSVQPDIPVLSFYYFKSVTTNQFINSVVSHQPNPAVPQESLLLTLRYSWFGSLVIGLYLVVVGAAVLGAVREWVPRLRGGLASAVQALVKDDMTAVVLYGLALIAVNLYVCAYAGFIYSVTMVPLIVMFLYRYVERLPRGWRWLTYAVTGLVVINNWMQVQLFRAAIQ